MAEEKPAEKTEVTPENQPSGTQAQNQGQNGTSNLDAGKLLEEKTKVETEYKGFVEKVNPIMQVIFSDPDVYKAVDEGLKKKLGIDLASSEKKEEKEEEKPAEKTEVTPEPSKVEVDNRNALIARAVNEWEGKHGVDKLDPDKKKDLNIKVLGVLRRFLDPQQTGKELPELIKGVSLTVLPQYLEDAYDLATKEEREATIKDKAIKEQQSSATGMIGAIPSSSTIEEEVTLTQKEKQIAKNMHMSEEDYLKSKKEIVKRAGELI